MPDIFNSVRHLSLFSIPLSSFLEHPHLVPRTSHLDNSFLSSLFPLLFPYFVLFTLNKFLCLFLCCFLNIDYLCKHITNDVIRLLRFILISNITTV